LSTGPASRNTWLTYLRHTVICRARPKLSQIYRVVKLDTIAQLVTFETPERIETFLMERSKRGELSLR